MVELTFDCLGQAFCLYLAYCFGLKVYKLISEYVNGSVVNLNKYGKWAVITGATDGIGLSFANNLAKQGQNIVLVSRNPEKLATVAKEIESKYQVETKCITADFSHQDIYDNIKKSLYGLDISILINNVGVSYEHPEFFLELDDRANVISKMISINVLSAVKMTEIILPEFVEKGKGVILNISSASACVPTPLLTLYSATKKFVICFSKSLNGEYASKGVVIQSLTPFFVCTKLSKLRHSSIFIPNPDTYVKSAMKVIGKSTCSYGYLPHAIQGLVIESLPEWLYQYFSTKHMCGIRKRALKKKSQSENVKKIN